MADPEYNELVSPTLVIFGVAPGDRDCVADFHGRPVRLRRAWIQAVNGDANYLSGYLEVNIQGYSGISFWNEYLRFATATEPYPSISRSMNCGCVVVPAGSELGLHYTGTSVNGSIGAWVVFDYV